MGANKRQWVIEMIEARHTYLKTYGTIDTFDSMVEKCHHNYVSWKYWYATKCHVDALAVVVAYDFYKECMTETLVLEAFEVQKDELEVMDFHTLKVKLSNKDLPTK